MKVLEIEIFKALNAENIRKKLLKNKMEPYMNFFSIQFTFKTLKIILKFQRYYDNLKTKNSVNNQILTTNNRKQMKLLE